MQLWRQLGPPTQLQGPAQSCWWLLRATNCWAQHQRPSQQLHDPVQRARHAHARCPSGAHYGVVVARAPSVLAGGWAHCVGVPSRFVLPMRCALWQPTPPHQPLHPLLPPHCHCPHYPGAHCASPPARATPNTACGAHASGTAGIGPGTCGGATGSACKPAQGGIERAGGHDTVCAHNGVCRCGAGWVGGATQSMVLRGLGIVAGYNGAGGAPQIDGVGGGH